MEQQSPLRRAARGRRVIELVDLPGTYTLEGGSPAEAQAAHYLDSKDVDVILNGGEAAPPEEPGYRSKQIVKFTREFMC